MTPILLIISFLVCLFIASLISSFSEILIQIRNKEEIYPYVWWVPGIVGGILFACLVLYFQ